MKTDIKGVSTCLAGDENYEPYVDRGRQCVQYEYRSLLTGNLFTCIARNLECARERRDAFMIKEKRTEAAAEKLYYNNHPELNP